MIESVLKALFSPASFHSGPGGFSVNGPAIIVMLSVMASFVLFFGSLVWVWQDARNRNKSGFVALVFILLTGWPARRLRFHHKYCRHGFAAPGLVDQRLNVDAMRVPVEAVVAAKAQSIGGLGGFPGPGHAPPGRLFPRSPCRPGLFRR